jgi:hypothetical protein
MNLLDKISKAGSVESTILSESALIHGSDSISTDIPIINVAFSGDLNGGYTSGLTVLAGPSKHFKSALALHAMKAYQVKYPDSVCLFYDSEFGITNQYLESFAINTDKVLHAPIKNIEELKFDLVSKLESINREDKIFILIDSIGNLASKKEVEDALSEKSVADMTRAKAMKSLFRIITPHLTISDIPLFAIAHTYDTQEMYSKKIISGGCLIEGTKIQTKDGLKEVQDFEVGEKVITLQGEREVTHVWNPETLDDGYPECYEIEFEDGHTVTCSGAHKFLTDKGWVAVDDFDKYEICEVMKM